MAERQINTKKGEYPPTKMTGEGKEDAEHEHDEKLNQDEEASQEKEDKTPVTTANLKAKRKEGSKSDTSDPADDDSDKNIDDDVPLSFPQRVSC
jgi:hypothetical protein